MAMAPLVIDVLLGIYIGLLTGIIPALVAGGLGFVFKYFTGVTLPGLGVVVLAVAIAGVSGGLLGLIDPTVASSPRLLVAIVVVMMLSMYSHAQGDRLGETLPRRFSLRSLGTRTLSGEVIFDVGGLGRVEITPFGDVETIEGYPPLPTELREKLLAGRWEFAADLPIEELERSLEERLEAEHDLAEVIVRIDDRARARIAAAPPVGALSRRIPEGHRAVSIDALVPTGISRGERVELHVGDRIVEGTVLSAKSDPDATAAAATDGGEGADAPPEPPAAPQTTGGEGRMTTVVTAEEGRHLLGHDRARVVVLPRGLGLEYEAIRMLRAGGNRFARVTVGASRDPVTVADLRVPPGAVLLAAFARYGGDGRSRREWRVDPAGELPLAAGDEVIFAGPPDAIDAIEGVVP